MKREIEFRALNANKEWVYGLISKDNAGDTIYYNEMPYRMCWFENTAHCNQPIITDTIGEFTGYTDIKGTRLFEGDIINNTVAVWEVIFNTGCFCARMKGHESKEGDMHIALRAIKGAVKIGNIYDNPELLK